MKIKTVLVAATAAGIGYVLGTKAGRARFEQLRGQAQDFIKSPTVQDTVANLSDTVKQSASKLPDPVANVVTAAADKVKGSTASGSGATDSADPAFPDAAFPETGATFTDAPVTDPTAPPKTAPPQ